MFSGEVSTGINEAVEGAAAERRNTVGNMLSILEIGFVIKNTSYFLRIVPAAGAKFDNRKCVIYSNKFQ